MLQQTKQMLVCFKIDPHSPLLVPFLKELSSSPASVVSLPMQWTLCIGQQDGVQGTALGCGSSCPVHILGMEKPQSSVVGPQPPNVPSSPALWLPAVLAMFLLSERTQE